jgi:hypothetical protein
MSTESTEVPMDARKQQTFSMDMRKQQIFSMDTR